MSGTAQETRNDPLPRHDVLRVAIVHTPLCPLRLTPDVYVEARKWWVGMNGEPPVAVADYTMTCPDYREDYSTC